MARTSAYYSYLHISDIPTQVLSRPQRTWTALLTLFLLAPIIPEMITGSTPPLMFINPISLLFETGLYGSGAILIRELVRRRGLGWSSIVLLGAAYGILEEGLIITSWFNPYWPDLGKLAYYGRVFDTSWIWAVGFVWLGLHARKSEYVTLQTEARPVPGLWKLRLLGFAVTFAFFFNAWVLPNIFAFPLIPLLIFFLIVILSWWTINQWAKRPGWDAQPRLALATGVLIFFALLAPLSEFVLHSSRKNMIGLTIVNLAFLLGLILLARVVAKRVSLEQG